MSGAAAPKKSKKGLLIGLGVGIPLLAGGVFVGLALVGIVKVPGLTPKSKFKGKASPVAAVTAPAAKPSAARKKTPPPAVVKKIEAPAPDPARGAAKLAEVWAEMEPAQLAALAKEYKDPDLALILSKMDADKAAEVLAVLDAKRAAKLSMELEKLGAVPPKES